MIWQMEKKRWHYSEWSWSHLPTNSVIKKQKEVTILKNLVLFNKIVVIFMALFVSLTVVNWKIINIFPSQSLQNVSLFSEITQIAFFFSIQAERTMPRQFMVNKRILTDFIPCWSFLSFLHTLWIAIFVLSA